MGISVGSIINQQYTVLKPINSGGMASVLLVQSLSFPKKRYALKIARVRSKDGEEHPNNVAIRKEANLLRRMEHARIVKVFPIGQIPGKTAKIYSARAINLPGDPWYFIMEYLAGGDLDRYVKCCGPLLVEEAVSIVLNVGLGLLYMHEAHHLAHNDIKPENIVFRTQIRKGEPYDTVLVDFGTAAGVRKFQDEAGSWYVMSPERIRGAKGLDPPEKTLLIDPRRSDIWSLGIVLYYALSKRLPFDSLSKRRLTSQILHTRPQPLGGGVPRPLERFIVEDCLAKQPQDRPTIRECLTFLRDYTHRLVPATSIKDGYYG